MAVPLKRIWNPPNPYVSEQRELLGEAPAAQLEIYEDESQEILSHNNSPDIGFRWSVNPYRGCFHACAYCFARPTHEYFGLGAGTDFERRIFVKRNAPLLLEKAFWKPSWKGEMVIFSGVTDCYQPLEAAWELTKRCLEVCLRFRNPVGIITKSLLIRRDKEILAALAKQTSVRIFLSIPFWDEKVRQVMEPGTPTTARRFETVALLARAGIPVGVGIAPVIPGLNDVDIPQLLKQAREFGARTAFYTPLRLPGSVRDVFFHRVQEHFPDRMQRIEHRIRDMRGGKLYDSRFGFRHQGQGPYWEAIEKTWDVWYEKLGFSPDREEKPPSFRRPPRAISQQEFNW